MTDERGGRYFREARFFLAGDQAAAQSHILDARSLMGYMRDMQAMGGPPIQVRYATLPDGTQIRAVMMNGQYQAEIVSPFGQQAEEKRRVLTIVGQRYTNEFIGTTERHLAFKWQKATGAVTLPLPAGRNYAYAFQASDDGSMVLGVAGNMTLVGGNVVYSDVAFVLWDGENAVSILPTVPTYHHIYDIQFNSTNYFDALPAIALLDWSASSAGVQNRFAPGLRHLLYGGIQSDVNHQYAATVEVAMDGTESYGLLESDPVPTTNTYSLVTDVDDSGNVLVGPFSNNLITPPGLPGTPLAIWQRTGSGNPYVRSFPHASLLSANGTGWVSGDGATVAGLVVQERTLFPGLYDFMPAVYTAQYGLEQMEPFYVPPGSSQPLQAADVHSISYDGNTTCGAEQATSGPTWVKAWQRDPQTGAWAGIPDLNLMFRGIGWHIN